MSECVISVSLNVLYIMHNVLYITHSIKNGDLCCLKNVETRKLREKKKKLKQFTVLFKGAGVPLADKISTFF